MDDTELLKLTLKNAKQRGDAQLKNDEDREAYSELKNRIVDTKVDDLLNSAKLMRPSVKAEIKDMIQRMSRKYDSMEKHLQDEIRSISAEKEQLKKECNLYKNQIQDYADDKLDYVAFVKAKQQLAEQSEIITKLQQKVTQLERGIKNAQNSENSAKAELQEEKKTTMRLTDSNNRLKAQTDNLNLTISELEERLQNLNTEFSEYQLMHVSAVEALDEELGDAKQRIRDLETKIEQVLGASADASEKSQKLLDMREEQAAYEKKVKAQQNEFIYAIARIQKMISDLNEEKEIMAVVSDVTEKTEQTVAGLDEAAETEQPAAFSYATAETNFGI